MMMKMVEKQKQISSGGSSSSSSRSNVQLPEDLIMEICSYVQPVSLLRFKSVSKKWYSLISNPHFLVRHTLLFHHQFRSIPCSSRILLNRLSTPGKSELLIIPPPPPPQNDEGEGEGDDYYRKLYPLLLQKLIDYSPEQDVPEYGKFMLLDSCNGLFLYKFYTAEVTYHWYVCNPITHDCIKLPTLYELELEQEQGLKIHYPSDPNLVFQPSLSLTFKVTTWLRCTRSRSNLEEEEEYRLYVYSPETRSWRLSITLNDFPVDHRPLHFVWRGVLCNGVLYWSTSRPPIHATLCYDVEKDRIFTLKFPNLPLGYTDRGLLYFGECHGRVRLIESFYNHLEQPNQFPIIFDVMELNEDQQQEDAELWTLKYRINIEDAELWQDVYILDLYKTKAKKAGGEEEEEEVMLLKMNDCIIPYNLSSNYFGKELRNGKKKKPRARSRVIYYGFIEVLRYNTITLFPPSSSLLEDKGQKSILPSFDAMDG